MPKVGYAKGECYRCDRKFARQRPINNIICPCWENCPRDHGRGKYNTLMEQYTSDTTSIHYGELTRTPTQWGDVEHPLKILRRCPICGYLSEQLPIEVSLE